MGAKIVCFPYFFQRNLTLTTAVHEALGLAEEPMVTPIAVTYAKLEKEYTASEIAAINVAKREYQKEYMEYWNSTSSLTGTGRPVDAILAPLAPFAAARPDMYDYYGTSRFHESLLIGVCFAEL